MLALTLPAQAALGIFEHGAGIKSQANGGISYAFCEESTVLAYNPAIAAALDERVDVGVSVFFPIPQGGFSGNLLGHDRTFAADGQTAYPVPQGGRVFRLSERWTLGTSLFAAGLGPDYPENPYRRFGGGHRLQLTLTSAGVATALAWQPYENHALGVSLNLGYQTLRVTGLDFLRLNLLGIRFSESPRKATNQGYDGRPTIGATLGWHGVLAPGVAAGLSYRTKTWTERHKDYRGLLPDRGSLELPAIWGGGVAVMPLPSLTLAYDFQRYEYEGERALGNRFQNFLDGKLFGSRNGAGFGFRDQTAHKFGLAWQATPALTLRLGYITANRITRESETLLDIAGSVNSTTHYTAGFTQEFGRFELSGFYAYAPEQKVRGEDSIPLILGGGEANTSFEISSAGLSLGMRFGD